MKNQLIATIVGALILFIWQFLSWAVLPIHHSEYGYTPNQDKIMEVLNQNLTEEGTYMVPGVPPGTEHEKAEADMASHVGRPWASITYHKAFNVDMGMNLIRGFALDLVIAYLLVLLLSKFETLTMQSAVFSSISVGVMGYLAFPYLHSIWFDENTLGHLIDAIVPWALVGAWLGWWLLRYDRVVIRPTV